MAQSRTAGRPRKSTPMVTVSLMLDLALKRKLQARASAEGMGLATWLRHQALKEIARQSATAA